MRGAALMLLSALVFGQQAPPAPSSTFTLGVLRRDGIVIPFAAYDGSRWHTPWPFGLKKLELPISVDAIDRQWWGPASPPRTMTLWANGKPHGELTLAAPSTIALPCGTRLGIRTNYHPALVPPPPTEQPFPKDGVVVTGGHTIAAIEQLKHNTPEMRGIGNGLFPAFDLAEARAIAGYRDWVHPLSREERSTAPIVMEAAYRAPMDTPGWTAIYVEASKRYAARPEDKGCGLVTSVRGWLRVNPQGRYRPELVAEITYCQRQGVGFFYPLGLIKLAERTHWIYQIAGYQREAYLVSAPSEYGVLRHVDYPAAFCVE